MKLVSFCEQNMPSIANTFFKHRRKATWISPNSKVKNTIDYALVRRASLNKVCDAGVLNQPDISDHKPLRLKISLEYISKKEPGKKHFKFNFKQLDNTEVRSQFESKISESLANLDENYNPESIYQKVQETLINTSMSFLGKNKFESKNQWISEGKLEAIKLKKEIRSNLGSDSFMYRLHKSNVKRLRRID